MILETPDDPERDRVRVVLCEARSGEIRARLLGAVVQAGRFPDLRLWGDAAAPAGADALRRMGFTSAAAASPRHRLSLLVRDLDVAATGCRLPDIAGWRLGMIDSDKC